MRVVILNPHRGVEFFWILSPPTRKNINHKPLDSESNYIEGDQKIKLYSPGGPNIQDIGTTISENTGKIHYFESRGFSRETNERQGKDHESTCI